MVKYGVFNKVLPYEQPKIEEIIKGDSICQYKVSAQQRATTHSFYKSLSLIIIEMDYRMKKFV